MDFDPKRLAPEVRRLPPRQRQILKQMGGGRSNKEIAADLDLSINTVKAHIKLLYLNLGIRSTSAAVRVAVATGLV